MEIKTNSPKAWLLATRPKTLTGAFIPVVLAAALAHHDGCLDWAIASLCLLFAGGMQIAANLINDLYDFLKGTDREDRLGPERACAQGWITPSAMKIGIWVSIAISCGFGLGALALTWQQLPWHGMELVALGLSCVVFAFLYTKVFSYLGLGDVLVLVFFGFVPVCGTYYLMAFDLPWQAWLLGWPHRRHRALWPRALLRQVADTLPVGRYGSSPLPGPLAQPTEAGRTVRQAEVLPEL